MNTQQMGALIASSVENIIKHGIMTHGSPNKGDAIYLATCAANAALQIIADLTAPEQTHVSTQDRQVSRNLN